MKTAIEYANALVCDQIYNARAYRMTEETDENNLPAFSPMKLFVQHHKGQAVIVTPRGIACAEMDPRQDCWIDGNVLKMAAEDYRLDIDIFSI